MSDSQGVLLRQLQQLKELRDSGALTQEGFEKRAAELLSGTPGEPRSPSPEEATSGDSEHWSASPNPGGSAGRWEAKPDEKSAAWSTPVATVTEIPAQAEARPASLDKPLATSSAETPVPQRGHGPSSQWSAAPDAPARLPSEAVSAEREIGSRIEDEPLLAEPEPSVSEPASEIGDETPATLDEPVAAAPVSKKDLRRWLRRDQKKVMAVEDHRAAAPADLEAVGDRGDDLAPVDLTGSETAPPAMAVSAEPLFEPGMESASMSVSEAAPDSAAIANVADLAGAAKEETKERKSWWRRGLADQQSPVGGSQALLGDAAAEDDPRSRTESEPGHPVAEDLQMRAGTERSKGEELVGVEQPFQRDLRWRRQSFLPAKWDEVRQGDRKGSYWDSSSRVVPKLPEPAVDQEKDDRKGTKAKSTYWSRNRKRD